MATTKQATVTPPAETYTTINMMGDSASAPDAVQLIEGDAKNVVSDPNGMMPWTSWPFGNLLAAVVEPPPADDPTPGSEIKFNTKVVSIVVKQDGTSGATAKSNLPTTTGGNGTGLLVSLAVAGGKVSLMIPAVGAGHGTGYQMGDVVTVTAALAGTSTDVVGVVSRVSQ